MLNSEEAKNLQPGIGRSRRQEPSASRGGPHGEEKESPGGTAGAGRQVSA